MTISVPAGSPVRPRQAGFFAALLALLVMTAGPVRARLTDGNSDALELLLQATR